MMADKEEGLVPGVLHGTVPGVHEDTNFDTT